MVHIVLIAREERERSCEKENLPANEKIPDIDRVDRLQEEIQGLMNVPVEETQTITKEDSQGCLPGVEVRFMGHFTPGGHF